MHHHWKPLANQTYFRRTDESSPSTSIPAGVSTTVDRPRPQAAAGLLVHVKAAVVGNWDALVREGKPHTNYYWYVSCAAGWQRNKRKSRSLCPKTSQIAPAKKA